MKYEVRVITNSRAHHIYSGHSGGRAIEARLIAIHTLVVAAGTADVQTFENGKLVNVKHVTDGNLTNTDIAR